MELLGEHYNLQFIFKCFLKLHSNMWNSETDKQYEST